MSKVSDTGAVAGVTGVVLVDCGTCTILVDGGTCTVLVDCGTLHTARASNAREVVVSEANDCSGELALPVDERTTAGSERIGWGGCGLLVWVE